MGATLALQGFSTLVRMSVSLSKQIRLRVASSQAGEAHFIRPCGVSLWLALADRKHWQGRAAKGKAQLRCFRPRR